jgi:hypothetical protein
LEEISSEKKKLGKKHHALLDDVKNFADNVSAKVMHDNYHNMNSEAREEEDMEKIKKSFMTSRRRRSPARPKGRQ